MVSKISMDILIPYIPALGWICFQQRHGDASTIFGIQQIQLIQCKRGQVFFFLMDVNLQHTCWLVGGVKQKTSGCYIVFSAHRYNTSLYTFQCQGKANFWSVSRFQTIPTPAFPRCPNKDSLEFWSVHPGETVIPAAFVSMSGPL